MDEDQPTEEIELGIDGLRDHQRGILRAFAAFCDDRGLRYYLAAGTLLGAVRHGGYIPWDDDIDVMMPRSDYEAFCREFPSEEARFGLRLHCLATDGDYVLPFAKVCDVDTRLEVESDIVGDIGIFVDVFPLDGWSQRRLIRWTQRIALALLLKATLAKHLVLGRKRAWPRSALLGVAKLVLKPVRAKALASTISRFAQMGRLEHCSSGGIIAWGPPEFVPCDAYGTPQRLTFEGEVFAGPANADVVLTSVFGDYRKLPPVEERVTQHRFRAFAHR